MTAYFTDPMREEFRKALEEAMKEGANLEDPDADSRSAGKKSSELRPASRKKRMKSTQAPPTTESAPKRVSKKKKSLLSRKLAKELR